MKYLVLLFIQVFSISFSYSKDFIQIEYCSETVSIDSIRIITIQIIKEDLKITLPNLDNFDIYKRQVCFSKSHQLDKTYLINYCVRINDSILKTGEIKLDSLGNLEFHRMKNEIVSTNDVLPKHTIDKKVKRWKCAPKDGRFSAIKYPDSIVRAHYSYSHMITKYKRRIVEIDAFSGKIWRNFIYDSRTKKPCSYFRELE